MSISDPEKLAKGNMIANQLWGNAFENRKDYKSEFKVAEVFPEFRGMIRGHLIPDVQARPGLVLRERIMVAMALNCLVGADYKIILKSKSMILRNIRASLLNGISKEQILEIIMHIAHYAGWSIANNALLVAKEVFSYENNLEGTQSTSVSEQSNKRETYNTLEPFQKGQDVLRKLDGDKVKQDFVEEFFPDFWEMTVGHLFGRVWSRSVLTLRERIIITLSINIGLKFDPGIQTNMRWALNNGISKEEILEIVMQVAHYRGWSVGINAIKVAKEVFD